MTSSVPSPKPGEGDTFHFPEIMLNVITSPPHGGYTIPRRYAPITRW